MMKNNLSKYLLFLVCALCSLVDYGQNVSKKEIINDFARARAIFEQNNLCQEYQTVIFANKSDKQAMERISSKIWYGSDSTYYLEENGLLHIQSMGVLVQIDSLAKEMVVTKADKQVKPIIVDDNNIDSLMNFFTIHRKDTSNYVRYDLIPKIAGQSFSLFMEKKTGSVYKVEILYPVGDYVQNSMEDEQLEQPLMVITYSPPKKYVTGERTFGFEGVLTKVEGRWTKMANLSEYELIDLRN